MRLRRAKNGLAGTESPSPGLSIGGSRHFFLGDQVRAQNRTLLVGFQELLSLARPEYNFLNQVLLGGSRFAEPPINFDVQPNNEGSRPNHPQNQPKW
jgi:hypothetical protein